MEVALWKRALAEFIGLFLFASIGLMVVATGITTGAATLFGLFDLSITFGLAIMVIIMVVGAVSGAHINPAITIALAVYRKFPWREVPVYIAAQIAGGVVGATVLYGLYSGPITAFERANNIVRGEPGSEITAMIFACFAPNPAIAGALEWPPGTVTTTGAFLAEAFATMVLALVVFAVVDERNSFAPSLPVFSLILGLVVAFIVAVEAPLTMAGINPARDLGPRIAITFLGWNGVSFTGPGAIWWVWTLGPISGAIVGGAVWQFLLGSFLTPRPEDALAAGTQAEELGSPTPGGAPTSAGASRD
ncbi:aquaporin family protein [Rubrobacter marinus]|uniref:Aquaporin family protein n=1 Tax=Rubrobacter marinus TaxID=2653852 RepID=A0A6G8Q0R3_9ACTN|nr:aquaporin [Rubrobacter marinus]QIN80035.1 aquaporin family protein [Rubrobacter marinus]